MSSKSIAVLGLGYVGLPLALALSRQHQTLGFDVNSRRISQLRAGEDSRGEVDSAQLAKSALKLSDDAADLASCDIYIVTVPTPMLFRA